MIHERDKQSESGEQALRREMSLASRYDALHAIPPKDVPPDVSGQEAIILEKIRLARGKLIDLGCGRGGIVRNAPKGLDFRAGVDFSQVFIDDAKERLASGDPSDCAATQFVVHDLNETLPFADQTFDIAVSCACIEHVFDVYKLFNEINRVLKPNSLFVFHVPNIAYIKHRLKLLFGRQPVTASSMDMWWRDYWDGTHLHYFTLRSLRMLLKQTNFEYQNVTGSGKLRRLRAWRPTLLTGDLIIEAIKLDGK